MPDTVIHDSECEAWRGGESWRADEACDCAFRAARHRDALVQAVLDALDVDDLRTAAFVTGTQGHRCLEFDATNIRDRLEAAAGALAALREAQPVTSSSEARVPHDFDTDAGLLHFAADCCDDRLTPSAIARVRELADLRPLEAAVIDAAKGAIGSYPRSPAQKKLNEALRTLKEAIDG